MQLEHLRGRKICDHVLKKGKVWKGRNMLIRWLPGAPRHPAADPSKNAVYVGTLASTKLDKSAVKRNRMRRRCREALRIVLKQIQDINTSSSGVGLVGPTAEEHYLGKGEPMRGKPLGFPLMNSVQLLISPRSSSLKVPFGEIQQDISHFFSTLTHGRSEKTQ